MENPYKTAGDAFARSEMSGEQHEMLNWILDGYYGALLDAIAKGRNLNVEQVRARIDRAPFMVEEAVEAGLLDGALYLDELASHLGEDSAEESRPSPAGLVNVFEVGRVLCQPVRKRSGKMIGVINIEGPITPGESRDIPLPLPIPVLGNRQTGSETITQMFRDVEEDNRSRRWSCMSIRPEALRWRRI